SPFPVSPTAIGSLLILRLAQTSILSKCLAPSSSLGRHRSEYHKRCEGMPLACPTTLSCKLLLPSPEETPSTLPSRHQKFSDKGSCFVPGRPSSCLADSFLRT